MARDSKDWQVKLIDFGEAFWPGQQRPVHCPLAFRAPEAVFGTQRGQEADTWSLGCTIFELAVGQPPFDNYMPDKNELIEEWISVIGDLPEQWKEGLPPSVIGNGLSEQISLRDWLHETYFEPDKKARFSKFEVDTLATLLHSMLQYRPAGRPKASDLLEHRYFQQV